MARVLVTGGTGALGREMVPRLIRAGHAVRVMTRRDPSTLGTLGATWREAGVEWVRADLATGKGLAEALAGSDVVIHAASQPGLRQAAVDVQGTERLLDRARAAGTGHFIYVSIVGVDRIPFSYYRCKLAAEERVLRSGLPWSIIRATQFHALLDGVLSGLARSPVLFLPAGFRFQPIDPAEVAESLVEAVAEGPRGRLPALGGPEVRSVTELARAWLVARQLRRPVVHLPIPGPVAAAFRRGWNTVPESRRGPSWEDWLRRTYPSEPGRAGS